jgi:hypothetical protein
MEKGCKKQTRKGEGEESKLFLRIDEAPLREVRAIQVIKLHRFTKDTFHYYCTTVHIG